MHGISTIFKKFEITKRIFQNGRKKTVLLRPKKKKTEKSCYSTYLGNISDII